MFGKWKKSQRPVNPNDPWEKAIGAVENSWTKGYVYTEKGSVCALGAISVAVVGREAGKAAIEEATYRNPEAQKMVDDLAVVIKGEGFSASPGMIPSFANSYLNAVLDDLGIPRRADDNRSTVWHFNDSGGTRQLPALKRAGPQARCIGTVVGSVARYVP